MENARADAPSEGRSIYPRAMIDHSARNDTASSDNTSPDSRDGTRILLAHVAGGRSTTKSYFPRRKTVGRLRRYRSRRRGGRNRREGGGENQDSRFFAVEACHCQI